MIDFHTHILPGIDDGSENSEMSCKMLEELSKQGVDAVVATPHFYYDEMRMDRFLANRDMAVQVFFETWDNNVAKPRPKLVLGAEVKFFYGLDVYGRADELCIQGTRYMLIEMPFQSWDKQMYQALASLNENREIVPVIAHVERYFAFNSYKNMIRNIVKTGALIQCNTSFFLSPFSRMRAFAMMKNGLIQFVGTDCHNLEKRKPNYSDAINVFKKKENGLYVNDLLFWEKTFNEDNPKWI